MQPPDAWVAELKRRGKHQRVLQLAFWLTLAAWSVGFGAIVSRLLRY